MLRVTDLEKSIKYYTEALGMQLVKKKENPEYKYTLAFMAYGPEEDNVVFELTHNWLATVCIETSQLLSPDAHRTQRRRALCTIEASMMLPTPVFHAIVHASER